MENLSDDDFRSYMNDFQSYLHNISDLGPIDPSSAPAPSDAAAAAAAAGVDAIQSVPEDQAGETAAAESSTDDWSAMSHRAEDRATGRTTATEEDSGQGLDEDDEDRIISEGCDLDCGIKDPDLIPVQSRPGWCPDIARGEEEEELEEEEEDGEGAGGVYATEEEGSSVDPTVYGLNQDASSPEEWQVETLKPSRRNRSDELKEEEEEKEEEGDWEVETLKPRTSRPAAPDLGFGGDQVGAVDETKKDGGGTGGGVEGDDQSSSPAAEQKTSWKYIGDDQSLQSYEQSEGHGRQRPDLNGAMTVSGAGLSEEQEPNSGPWETAAEPKNREEEEEEEGPRDDASSDEDDHFALDRSQSATLVKTNRTSVVHDEIPTPFEAAAAQLTQAGYSEKVEEQESEDSAKRSSGYYHELVPEDEAYFGTAEAMQQQPISTVAETKSSEGRQNGAQLSIYPSQVRKTNNIFADDKHRRNNGCEVPESPTAGENGAAAEEDEEEEGGKDLPEQGSVKTLLAQWRQIEQQKRKAASSAAAADGEGEGDDETKSPPTRSRVRDEILRMRSQSCDPLSSRKHNRLSPNDDEEDEAPTAGASRVGRGRSRGTGNEEDDDDDGGGGGGGEGEGGAERYRSQPSLSTRAIMAKFENLDLQAANSAVKPKTSKNFKWQVKETTSFCRPGFQPRSGR